MRRAGSGGGARERATGRAVVLAVVVLLGAVAGCGVEPGPGDSGGSILRPPAGTTLDGRKLPKPASNLFVAGHLVEYLTVTDDRELELVAVDPTAGRVAWRQPAAVGLQPEGVSLSLSGIGDDAAILHRPVGSDRWVVRSIDPRGRIRWEEPIAEPVQTPERCADRLCVELSSGVVSFPARGGSPVDGGLIGSDMRVVGTGGGWSLVVDRAGRGEVAVALLGVPRFHRDGRWRRRLGDVFHGEQVTPDQGWHGVRYDDTWVLWLGSVSDVPEGEVPDFPYEEPQGSVAALSVRDGEPRWVRRDIGVCHDLVSDDVMVLCDAPVRYPSDDERGTRLTSAFERVDPETGKTDFRVDLREPLDLFDTEERLLRLDDDRWLLRDGEAVREIDLAAGTEGDGSLDAVGWCLQTLELDEVRGPFDEPSTYRAPDFFRPCTLGTTPPKRAELLAPIVDRRLGAPDDSTVVEVGPWVVWVDDGHLAGVVTEA